MSNQGGRGGDGGGGQGGQGGQGGGEPGPHPLVKEFDAHLLISKDQRIMDLEQTCAGWMTEAEARGKELADYVRRIAELEELHIMQLVAISTASVQNTEATIKDRIGPDHIYCTTAYLDVCRAVDREMKHRDRIAELEAAHARMVTDFRNLTETYHIELARSKSLILAEKRIAELEAQVKGQENIIADFSSNLLYAHDQRMEAMTALLDQLLETHIAVKKSFSSAESGPFQCPQDCPACAWARLKEGK